MRSADQECVIQDGEELSPEVRSRNFRLMVIAAMFLGGWHYPFYADVNAWSPLIASLVSLVAFGIKVLFWVLFQIWMRWTLPRFRYDQLMNLGWKVIIPLALVNLVLTAWINLPGAN